MFACSLFEVRVRGYIGTITMEEMLAVFSISRKAQNFWHYRTMCSMPGFDELTSRCRQCIYLSIRRVGEWWYTSN